MPLSLRSVVKSSFDCGAQVRRGLHAQALGQPAPDAPPDAAFRSMLPRLARYRAAWGDANVPCALGLYLGLCYYSVIAWAAFPARQMRMHARACLASTGLPRTLGFTSAPGTMCLIGCGFVAGTPAKDHAVLALC